jgi:hypothetical protein
MSIELFLICSMCSEERQVPLPDLMNGSLSMKHYVESYGWFTQQSEQNFDIYCSPECAE